MQELPFLHSARRLMLIDICMKFREDSFRGFQVTERTRFVTDRQTDRQTDGRTSGRPGKNNMSPNPSGGRHNERIKSIVTFPFETYVYWLTHKYLIVYIGSSFYNSQLLSSYNVSFVMFVYTCFMFLL